MSYFSAQNRVYMASTSIPKDAEIITDRTPTLNSLL